MGRFGMSAVSYLAVGISRETWKVLGLFPGKSFLSASSSLSLIAEKNAVFSEIMTMMTTVKIISSLIIIMEYDIIGNCISFEI